MAKQWRSTRSHAGRGNPSLQTVNDLPESSVRVTTNSPSTGSRNSSFFAGINHAVSGLSCKDEEDCLDTVVGGGNSTTFRGETLGVIEQTNIRLIASCPSDFNEDGTVDVNDLLLGGKSIRGIVEGDSVARKFIPQLVELYQQGRFPFDKLVKFYSFDEINQAAEDSEKGITLKPIVRIGD
jgi:Zn-dependent alcohol dehydrogenase